MLYYVKKCLVSFSPLSMAAATRAKIMYGIMKIVSNICVDDRSEQASGAEGGTSGDASLILISRPFPRR